MFGRKKKKGLFGTQIEQSCAYCRRNGGKPGEPPICTLRLTPKKGKCKKYEYDPLMREPKAAPGLGGGYTAEDFKL